MTNSAKLGVPLLAANQSQKHVTVNDSLQRYDQLVQMTVINRTTTAPPGSPSEGHAYIVATGATGDWATQVGNVAAWVNGAWLYFTPREGWIVWDEAADEHVKYDGSDWVLMVTGDSGSFTTNDGKTVTVVNGLITDIT
mgnify:CR=1 FL=1